MTLFIHHIHVDKYPFPDVFLSVGISYIYAKSELDFRYIQVSAFIFDNFKVPECAASETHLNLITSRCRSALLLSTSAGMTNA
jgi:hypothetical protein